MGKNSLDGSVASWAGAMGGFKALWDNAGMLLVFALVFMGCAAFVPRFLSGRNLELMALSVSMMGMVACTMLFCLASGHFDLSVGSVVATSSVVTAMALNATDSIVVGIAAGMLAGGVVGVLNGLIIAKYRINALITTLATMQIVRGAGQIISKGASINISKESFFVLGQSSMLGVVTPVWITLGCFVLFGLLLRGTTYGRNTLAVGGNEEAARLAGIAVDRIKITIFTLQGLMAGAAGVIYASRFELGNASKTAIGFELQVISACVLGGVSMSGGIGTIWFAIAGVLIMGTVENAMTLRQIDPFWQRVVTGAILLAAVMFDRFKQSRGK